MFMGYLFELIRHRNERFAAQFPPAVTVVKFTAQCAVGGRRAGRGVQIGLTGHR